MINAILIDPDKKEILIVEIKESSVLEDMRKIMNCEFVEKIGIGVGNCLFVDEEGLFKEQRSLFAIKGFPQALTGKAVIIYCFNNEFNDPTFNIEQVKKAITFPK